MIFCSYGHVPQLHQPWSPQHAGLLKTTSGEGALELAWVAALTPVACSTVKSDAIDVSAPSAFAAAKAVAGSTAAVADKPLVPGAAMRAAASSGARGVGPLSADAAAVQTSAAAAASTAASLLDIVTSCSWADASRPR